MRTVLNRVGEVRKMKNGMDARVIAYHSSRNITVQFSNGIVRRGVRYDHFKNGSVAQKDSNTTARRRYLGVSRRMNCGINATIVEYYNSGEILVKFDTGETRTSSVSCFNRGAILPVPIKRNHLGESHELKDGSIGTIVKYKNVNCVDVYNGKAYWNNVGYNEVINKEI